MPLFSRFFHTSNTSSSSFNENYFTNDIIFIKHELYSLKNELSLFKVDFEYMQIIVLIIIFASYYKRW
jgi:hypothetical protein